MQDYRPYFDDDGQILYNNLRAAHIPFSHLTGLQSFSEAFNKRRVVSYAFDDGVVIVDQKLAHFIHEGSFLRLASVA
jgi:hypothetical protein